MLLLKFETLFLAFMCRCRAPPGVWCVGEDVSRRGRWRGPRRTPPPQPELKPDQGPDPLQSVGGGPLRVSHSLDNASPRPSGLDLPATGFEVAVDRI